jgi:DNA-binding CsgD family transcriptional regulator
MPEDLDDLSRMRAMRRHEPPAALQRLRIGMAAVLAAMTLLVCVDFFVDVARTREHIELDLLIGFLGLGGIAAASVGFVRTSRRASDLQGRLRSAEEEAERFREESRTYLRGLAAAIDRQLSRWSLSRAEREVVLLLLKGLSHKEIASVRDCSERTVRQQARVVYRKAGLGGRVELAAFFLEDLLVPSSPAHATEPAAPELKAATFDAPRPAGT